MKTDPNASGLSLSPELAALFRNTPAFSANDRQKLGDAIRDLDDDPSFRSEYLKGLFVEEMLAAMEELGLTQADVAKRWKKTRQYVSSLLNENRRVNFTIETMVEFAHIVGRRLEQHIVRSDEATHVLRCKVLEKKVGPKDQVLEKPEESRARVLLFTGYGRETRPKAEFNEYSCIPA